MTEPQRRPKKWSLDQDAAERLAERGIIHEWDRSGPPHFAVKVPDLSKALEADLGIEIDRESDGCVTLSVLLYDIPTEPVTYDLRLYPDQHDDLRLLCSLLQSCAFHLRPCQFVGGAWAVGPSQTFRLPPNMVLRLKHISLDWPTPDSLAPPPASEPEDTVRPPKPAPKKAGSDPRDTVIRKLKEQVHTLRGQVQERDKRIIELEDELHDLKSRGRSYRLSGEKRTWWKPF